MIINNNIPALNTYRQMGINQKSNANAMEKLSSGLRINKAGDDAAGLAISEKMRAQVRGLDQASRNSQDGISMIQTAEGALQETQNILQRMRELATQAANDTNVEVDRAEIQKEMNALTSEINRIGETTEFNTQKLLKGDGSSVKEVGALELAETGLVSKTSLQGGKVDAATSAKLQLSLASAKGADDLNGEEFTFEFNGNSIKLDIKTVATAGAEGANTFEVKDGGNEVSLTLVAGDTNQKFIMSKIQESLAAAMAENANIEESNYTLSRDEAVLSITSVATGEGQSISVKGASTNDALTANLGPTAAKSTAENALAASMDWSSGVTDITINGETVNLTEVANISSSATFDAAADIDTIVSKLQEDINRDLGENKYTVSKDGNKLVIESVDKGSAAAVVVAGTSEAKLGFDTTDVEVPGTAGTFNAVVGTKQEVSGTKEIRQRATATIDSFTAANLKDQIIASGIASDNTDYFAGGNVTDAGAEKFLTGKGFSIGNETIEFFNSNEAAYEGTADHAVDLALVDFGGTGNTYIEADDMEALVSSIVSQIGSKMDNVTLSVNTTTASKLDVTAKDPGTAGNSIEVNDAASRAASDVIGSTFEATFQIGANSGQSMTIQVGDMRAQALGVSGKESAGTITAKNGETAKLTAAESVTNGTNNEEVEFALDVSTHENASAAISVINDAIESVSAQRSSLGAFQNRLEHTISNLGTSSENLQAAESRIRDVDMAKEVMEMTRTNILSQASQAMLAQANQKPQSVLQLLG